MVEFPRIGGMNDFALASDKVVFNSPTGARQRLPISIMISKF